ncbi:MAG: tetratricopeptide repeat protein [Halothece sp. Uz-M2-17]|nr:tetratricopeptide repeat protein [Halothece sp. Uz-M2-17]
MSRESEQNLPLNPSPTGQVSPALSRYKLGKALADKGRWQEAITYYRQALELDPNLSEARQALEKVLAKTQASSAQNIQSPAIPEKTPEGRKYRQQSQYYARQKQWQAAAQELEKLIQVEPSFEAYRDLGRVHTYLKQPAKAAQSWYQAFTLDPEKATTEEYIKLGNTLFQQEQWEQAIHCYQQVLKRDPNSFTANRSLGATFARQGKWEEAITAYHSAIALNPESAVIHKELGIALEHQERWEEAIASYRQAITLEPNDLASAQQLLNLLEKRQDWQELEAVCRQGIEQHPKIARFHHLLGDALLKLERWEEAAEAYHSAISRDANFSWSYNNLGDALLKLERWEDAAEAYRNAIALKDDFVWSYYNLGRAALAMERWEEALKVLQQAVQLNQELPAVEELLGDTLRMRAKADLKKAVDYYRSAITKNPDYEKLYHKALDAKPDDADLYLQLANVLSRQGREDGAIAFYQIALQFDPENAEASYQLGQSYQKKMT